MNHREWHEREMARNPDYATAAAEINLAQTIADTVVAGRIRAGLSQKELAKLAKTTQARISRLENGEGNPTINTVADVLAVLAGSLDLGPLNAVLRGNIGVLVGSPPMAFATVSGTTVGARLFDSTVPPTATWPVAGVGIARQRQIIIDEEVDAPAAANSELAKAA